MWHDLKYRFVSWQGKFRFITRIIQILAGIVGFLVVIVGIIYSDDTSVSLILDDFQLYITDLSKNVDYYKYEIFLSCLILVASGVWVRARATYSLLRSIHGRLG